MARYIELDALVAEIERLQDVIKATAIDDRISKEQAEAYKVCVKLRSFVEDTLEVKEVDLGKEIQDHIRECLDVKFPTTDVELIKKDVAYTAKKFFELGMQVSNKAQKGEEL